jgi:hypothetical protein
VSLPLDFNPGVRSVQMAVTRLTQRVMGAGPPNAAEPLAFPHPLARSQSAWDAFFSAGLFDFDEWDLAPARCSAI